MDDDERQVWELSVELGPPEAARPASLHGDGIHPVAQLLEASARRIREPDSIPCFTSFGPVTPLDEFAQRVWGETFARERVPVECRLTVYVTDEELDDLSEAVVVDLGLNRDGFSSVLDRTVVVGLHPISLTDPENEFYRQFVGHHEEAVVRAADLTVQVSRSAARAQDADRA